MLRLRRRLRKLDTLSVLYEDKMKRHFAAQITESPRHRHSYSKSADWRNRAIATRSTSVDPEEGEEHLPYLHMSMSKGNKDFTDVLGPLRRYLLQSVGRRWDDVYSEISQNIPSDSMQGRHIRQHVEGYVEQEVILIDNKPYRMPKYGTGPVPITRDFYVNPVTGLLQKPVGGRGLYLTPDGRLLRLETWAGQHRDKPVERVKVILALAKDEYGRSPTADQIQQAVNKVAAAAARPALLSQRRKAAREEKAQNEAAALKALVEAQRAKKLAKKK